MFFGEFDASAVPEQEISYGPLPEGWYQCVCAEATFKDTKSGTGKYIQASLTVEGPSHQGRRLFARFNIQNANDKAQDIGIRQFGEFVRAVGLVKVNDTDMLVGRRCSVKVKTRTSEQHGDQSDPVNYRAIEGSSAPAPSFAAPAPKQAPAAPAQAARPPWQR
jgi:hypothetical protein